MFFVPRNQRVSTRHAVELSCQVVRERDFRLVGDTTLDLSAEGMLVRSVADLTPGEDVLVSFHAKKLGIWFDMDARVARVIRGRRPTDRGRAIGLRFHDISPISRLILRGHLRRLPPPVPRREVRVDYAETVRRIAELS